MRREFRLVGRSRASGEHLRVLLIDDVARQQHLDRAVARARKLARRGDVVLLSPACASFDQFRNFEHRGEAFRALVESLT